MLQIKISGKLLTTIRQEIFKSEDDIFLFILHLMRVLYENRDKTVDVAFMTYLSNIEYSSLKAFFFSEELPSIPFVGEVEFSMEYGSFLFNVERLFRDDVNSFVQYMKFGADLSSLLR
jgi:hypothetical protein